MCDDQVSGSQKILQSVAAGVPKIVVQRAEEIFPAVKQMMNCLNSQKEVPGSHSEACLSLSLSGVQAVNIKVEEVSDMEGGEDPVPMPVVGIKAAHEEDVPASHSEACSSSSLSGVQAVNIKVEEYSDMEGGEDPVPMTVVGIKAEHEDCPHPHEDVPGSYTDTCPTTSHGAFQAISIKDEEVSDVEEVEDPLSISFPGIKAEHAAREKQCGKRHLQHETGIENEIIVFQCIHTETVLQCGKLANVASPHIHISIYITEMLCTFTAVSVQTDVTLGHM
ncbi:uncharacterized protein LOC111862997 isoform X4 [Cryptotermes secundus]|uniref:uncharacterized protein LOC111862997 isoform X4 n=1 Tax=Cryptotermes secundus TaxID=105785 RepID=UPI001454D3AB|nr:uncharacterized protein LOC111862997 isoform X4 [Cryptotermes secundus]